jgi:quercetin dioxygenase-like cupin family protein
MQNQISVKLLHQNKLFKVLQASGKKGSSLPTHYCTDEAFIVANEGTAILEIEGKAHVLAVSSHATIPANARHTLRLTSDFLGFIVMHSDASIQYVR